jgi:hypothetical protein
MGVASHWSIGRCCVATAWTRKDSGTRADDDEAAAAMRALTSGEVSSSASSSAAAGGASRGSRRSVWVASRPGRSHVPLRREASSGEATRRGPIQLSRARLMGKVVGRVAEVEAEA